MPKPAAIVKAMQNKGNCLGGGWAAIATPFCQTTGVISAQ
jgi:hypothetical protein